jgi:hypothetical protein
MKELEEHHLQMLQLLESIEVMLQNGNTYSTTILQRNL